MYSSISKNCEDVKDLMFCSLPFEKGMIKNNYFTLNIENNNSTPIIFVSSHFMLYGWGCATQAIRTEPDKLGLSDLFPLYQKCSWMDPLPMLTFVMKAQ